MMLSRRRTPGCLPPLQSTGRSVLARPSPSAGNQVILAILAGLLTVGASPARASEDDLVPAGIVEVHTTLSHETQTKAIARDAITHGLEVYALPSPNSKDLVSGQLSRDIDEADLLLKVGITDHWNLSLLLPYVRAAQHSNLQSKFPGLDPVLDVTVARLQDQTVSGAGNLRLTSLHRPVFSDFHGFVWGYGYQGSLESNTGVYTGIGSLQTRDPYGGVYGFVHYTYYPRLARSRLDLRGEYQYPFADKVNTPRGTQVTVRGGATSLFSLGWEHEPGAWGYGMALQSKTSQPTQLDGDLQEDTVKEYLFHGQLGFGNLIELEQQPIRFPYQALLTYDTTVYGYNTPLRERWSLVFLTYF